MGMGFGTMWRVCYLSEWECGMDVMGPVKEGTSSVEWTKLQGRWTMRMDFKRVWNGNGAWNGHMAHVLTE